MHSTRRHGVPGGVQERQAQGSNPKARRHRLSPAAAVSTQRGCTQIDPLFTMADFGQHMFVKQRTTQHFYLARPDSQHLSLCIAAPTRHRIFTLTSTPPCL
jgi:hypothetical protein